MKKAKRNIIIVAVLLFVCAAVYLNWSYNNRWGKADEAMVDAEDAAANAANADNAAETGSDTSEYFAQARLTRQESRDEALGLLQTAAASESASQETIDAAMNAIAAMATYSMQEAQIENLLIAKDFTDCVVYMSADGITLAVPAPPEGLSEAAVARITDTIISETDYDATQIKVIEIKNGAEAQDASDILQDAGTQDAGAQDTADVSQDAATQDAAANAEKDMTGVID